MVLEDVQTLSTPWPGEFDFTTLCAHRERRARILADGQTATRQALEFYAAIAAFQARVCTVAPLDSRADLVELVARIAPDPLRATARQIDAATVELAVAAYGSGEDTESLRSFFARVLLGPAAAAGHINTSSAPLQGAAVDSCPLCNHAPQVGCLRESGDGTTLSLICSLCLSEWGFPRSRCPACGKTDEAQLGWYGTDEHPQLQVRACYGCQRYLHVVSVAVDPDAIPDVDEVSGLPLDLWAREQGYRKLRPNLVGI